MKITDEEELERDEEIVSVINRLMELNLDPYLILRYDRETLLNMCNQIELNRRYRKLAKKIINE